jgi:RNA polymerase sigma-70 factor (ECF subfamily)
MPQLQFHADAVDRRHDRANLAHPAADADEVFEDVVRRYRQRVLTIAYRITANIDDARDVVQHVFLQLHLKPPEITDGRALERWLYIVARNEALSIRRRRQRDDAAEASIGDDAPPAGLEETVLRNERARQIRATIARLPAADRHVIELRHLLSMPSVEIATTLGIPLKRVKRDVERAKTRLRIEMRRRGLENDT